MESMKFKQITVGGQGELYALGEDGFIYEIEHKPNDLYLGIWESKDKRTIEHKVTQYKTFAVRLYPGEDKPHRENEQNKELPYYYKSEDYEYKAHPQPLSSSPLGYDEVPF